MKKPLKIAVDIRDLRIARTGARTYLEELMHEFRTHGDPGMKFLFFDTEIPVYTGRNKFLKLIEHIRFIIWKQIRLPLKMILNRCDILLCTDYFVPLLHPGYKTVVVFHDAFFYEYPHHYNKIWLYLFKTLGVSAATRSYAIVTPTWYTKARIAQLSGIPESMIRVIYEGPKSICMDTSSSGFKPAYRKYLLHVGTMEIRKNIINLLKAYRLLLETHPDIKLVLIGQFSPKSTIDDREAILNYISEHKLEERVIFTGYVSDTELSSYYSNALAYVFPSLNEGFGIPILEAFRAGVPVLVANNTCLPEVGGDAVITFDPYSAEDINKKVIELIDNPDLQKEMKARGYKRLELFNWRNAADQLIALFKEAIT